MAFIFPAPGVANVEATLAIRKTGDTSGLLIPAMQDITVNNSNDLFTWTQLDEGSKLNVATTATNSLDLNIVLDQTVFFGTGSGADVAINKGIFGLSKDKTEVSCNNQQRASAKLACSIIPLDTIPIHAVPTDTVPTDTVPAHAVPTDAIPTDAAPDHWR